MAQATVTYTGVSNIISARMTFSSGITPSICALQVPMESVHSISNGTLWFVYSGTSVIFQDCALVQFRVSSSSGGNIADLQIADRRWQWQYGNIRGAYNRRVVGDVLDADTEQTPTQLVSLLLDAMGESDYDVSRIGTDRDALRPEVEWDDANPAQALADLCDELGLRIVLNYESNHVELWPIGIGTELTVNSYAMSPATAISGNMVPSKILVIGAPTVWQSVFTLQAVGLDNDDRIKLLQDLSYKPAGTWEVSSSNVLDQNDRALARQSVYRWYKIWERWLAISIPYTQGLEIADLQFLDRRLEYDEDGNQLQGRVFGSYFDESTPGQNTSDSDLDQSHSLAEQVVRLNDAAFRLQLNTREVEPALLLYECTFTAVDTENHLPVRRTLEWTPPDAPTVQTEPLVIRRNDLLHSVVMQRNGMSFQGWDDNAADFDAAAQEIAEEAWRKLQYRQGNDITYEGIRKLKLDGIVAQISWSVGGNREATTRASSHVEHSLAIPVEQQRRRKERLDRLATRRDLRYRRHPADQVVT